MAVRLPRFKIEQLPKLAPQIKVTYPDPYTLPLLVYGLTVNISDPQHQQLTTQSAHHEQMMQQFSIRLLVVILPQILCSYTSEIKANDESTVFNNVAVIASEFMNKMSIHGAVLFNCQQQIDNIAMIHNLMSKGIRSTFQTPVYKGNLSYLLHTKYHPLAVVVDLKCEKVFEIIIKASDNKLFSSLHYWLLLNLHDRSKEALFANLESLELTLNSHLTIAHHGPRKQEILLQDAYRLKDEEPLIIKTYPIWILGESMPLPPHRDNYGGLMIKTAVVVSEGTWESFPDLQYRHLNTENKALYYLMTYISRMLNFRINVSLTNTWGYPLNGSKCFNGAVGLLQCGDTDISASGLLYKEERLNVIDYAGDTFELRSGFFFLKPSLSEVSVIYTLPFSPSVWITYTVSVTVLVSTLVVIIHILQKTVPYSLEKLLSWRDFILDSVAIVCQQGTLWNPACLSSRILFLLQLLLSVFLITSYSAIIVSLLQTSSDKIKNMNDLMNSSMKLSMIDIYVNETTDPQVRRIFEEKLYTQPFQEAFTTQEVGMQKIRRGLYAFHCVAGAYKIISDTYEEQEKCRLKEIPMFTSLCLAYVVKKGSPFGEHLKQKTNWLRESGLIDHEDKKWFYQRPKCDSSGQFFVSINIQDFYPTLVVLLLGILLSILVFMIEFLHIYLIKRQEESVPPFLP